MKYIHSKIRRCLLGLALVLCAQGSYATVAQTCRDYDVYKSNTVLGSVTATQLSECQWQLTASPERNFDHWEIDGSIVNIVDGSATTTTITIELRDLTVDTIPCLAHFQYTIKYCKSCGDFDIESGTSLSYPHEDDTIAVAGKDDAGIYGTISATHLDGSCWQLYAQAKDGYTFAQWSDGTYENPRTIFESFDHDTVSYYATFIPENTLGKVDEWLPTSQSLRVTTKESEGTLTDYYATVFYGDTLVISREPGEWAPGVYDLDAPAYDADELAGKKCHVVFKNEHCEPLATLDTIIPYIVTSGVVDVPHPSTLDGTRAKYGVHVLSTAQANFETSMDIVELDIYPGGKALIDDDVTVSSVTMRAHGPNMAYPELLVTDFGTLTNNNGDTVYFDYALNDRRYYPFSLPYTVNTSEATYRSGADASEHFAMDAYNGANRAAGGRGWYYYLDYPTTGDVDVEAGKGYDILAEPMTWNGSPQTNYLGVIRFPMTADLSGGPETTKNNVPVVEAEAANPANSHWNLIGSPYLFSCNGPILMYNGSTLIDEVSFVYSSTDFFKSYDHTMSASMVFEPFHSYFIQIEATTDHIVFPSPDAGRAYAPGRRKATSTAPSSRIQAGITLTQGDKTDHTGLFIGDKYTNDYDINGDLSKMFGSSQGMAVFMLSGNQKLANIALPQASGNGTVETVIPLGYNKAKVGSNMTFAFDEERYPSVRDDERIESLYLIDYVEGLTIDLMQDSYTCSAYEAANNERFALGIRYIKTGANVTTDICDDATPTKMSDGIYDLMGRRIEADDARTLGAGVYIIIENGKTRKEVIR